MSYCVNCGVELDASLADCPLCNTPVINPKAMPFNKMVSPFPKEKGQVEVVKKKDLAILISCILFATAATCGLLNWLFISSTPWSVTIIGLCAVLWVFMIPVIIYTKQPIYLSILYDGIVAGAYLYLLTWMTEENSWFWELGLPIVIVGTVIIEVVLFCIKVFPKSFLVNALYSVTAVGLFCLGIEFFIDRYLKSRSEERRVGKECRR